VGERVSVTARVVYAEDRLLRFEVVARRVDAADDEKLLAHGEVTRVIVDRDRFLARLSRPSE
jgi:predicted thioesterase